MPSLPHHPARLDAAPPDPGRSRSPRSILIGTSLRDLPIAHHFVSLAREFGNLGYEAVLLIHGPIETAGTVDPKTKVLSWPSPRPTSLAAAWFFDRLVRRLNPCCLISNFGSRAIMMTIGGLRRVPVRIHWHHTLSSQIEADQTDSHLKLRLLRWRARIPFSLVTHAVANSNAARDDLVATFGVPQRKCQVFWNSLEDPLADSALGFDLRAKQPAARHFVCVGRFAASKGQDILLQAMTEVVKRHPDATIEFIGKGPLQSSCEALAARLGVAKNCLFAGYLAHPNVLSGMAGAWATVVPSRNEAFGLVNIESMAVGVPVIGSNTGGIVEIIRDGEDGFLFPPGDHAALARRMLQLIDDEPLRRRMASSARNRFLEVFESSRAVKLQARWIVEQINQATNHQ